MIPANLITGFLGVGKTTAVVDLLRTKASTEHWAVLVNEYGEVGIDAALIEGSSPSEGVSVQEVAGGCVCCATAPYLPVALHFLLHERKPDRLLIETTGLGHPARLLDLLRSPSYADRIELRATLGIVAPADFVCPGMLENPIFMDQVHLADVLVLNKADKASPEVILQFRQWANELFPPKWLFAATEQGRIDPAWLDLTANNERVAQYPESHDHTEVAMLFLQKQPRPGLPARYESPSGSVAACGWIFHHEDIFDEEKLLACLQNAPGLTRWKGVFHVLNEWISVHKTSGGTTVNAIAYRRDSRLEVFASQPGYDWVALEKALLATLIV